jgi:hypothetical protein
MPLGASMSPNLYNYLTEEVPTLDWKRMDIICAILAVLEFLFRIYLNAKGITPIKFNAI